MGLFDIFKIFKRDKRKNVYTPIDEDWIKRDEVIKAQQKKIMAMEAQLSQIFSKEKEKRDKEKNKDKEQEINKKLHEKEADLKANRLGKKIKLGKFYQYIFSNKRFRENLEIVDKDDTTVLGKFGDFVIMTGGKLGLVDDKGELMSYGRTLQHVLYKPDAFENMARRGRLTIPVDADGNWIEDLEYKEMPEPLDAVFDEETGKIKKINWSKVRTNEVKKIIGDKIEKINFLSEELDRSESVNIKLRSQLDDSKRSSRTMESQYYTAQSELSKNLNIFVETEKRTGDIHNQVVKLTELKAMYENLIERKDEIILSVMKKLDLTGDRKTDLVKEEVRRDLEFYKKILPSKIEIKEEAVKPTLMPVQPGEIIRR